MDKKLLLAMQYQCNYSSLNVPWDDIGRIMGEGITGGAVIQHLAKLRARMIAQGLSVPPPLRRGGGGPRIATAASRVSKAKATPAKGGKARATQNMTKSTPAKPKKTGKKAAPGSDESEEEDDDWKDEDSDADYGERPAKRAKSGARGPMRRNMKTEDSDEEDSTPPKALKRKRQGSKLFSHELSAYGTTDINGVPIDYDSETGDDDGADAGVVAAGAPWLSLEDDLPSHPKTGKKTVYKKKSLVVALPTSARYEGLMKEETSDDHQSEVDIVGGVDNNSCHAEPQTMRSNGDLYQTTVNQYNNSDPFEIPDDLFDNGGVIQNQTMEQSGSFQSGNFDFGHTSTNFTDQGPGNFGGINGGFGGDYQDNGGVGMSNDIVQQGAFAYQTGNGYGETGNDYGVSFNGFGNNAGAHSLSNDHNYSQTVPYPIQTSWPVNYGTVGASNETSVNQTPAGTSAGVDVGTGYFGSGPFDETRFDAADFDFSANEGAENLFNAGHFDGNFVGGGLYGSDSYGN